jgi:hypothetical protein
MKGTHFIYTKEKDLGRQGKEKWVSMLQGLSLETIDSLELEMVYDLV